MWKTICLFPLWANVVTHVDPKAAIPKQCLCQSCQPRFHAGGGLGQDASVPDTNVFCSYIKQHCACFQVLQKSIFNVPLVMPLHKKVKVAHMWLPSIGSQSWYQFLGVSLQMMWLWAINLVAGCHYFPPGPQLPSQPLRGLLPIFAAWGTEARWVWTVCLRLSPDSTVASM